MQHSQEQSQTSQIKHQLTIEKNINDICINLLQNRTIKNKIAKLTIQLPTNQSKQDLCDTNQYIPHNESPPPTFHNHGCDYELEFSDFYFGQYSPYISDDEDSDDIYD